MTAPRVEGEPSAGHPRLAFRWSTPAGAHAFRARIDFGPWQELPLSTTSWVTPEDLVEGAHVFEVEARDANGLWSPPGSYLTRIEYFEQPGFWNGAARSFATTPLGHICAISAHNCYSTAGADPAENLALTLAKIHAAQLARADLVELDVKDEGGATVVGHDDGIVGGPLLSEVLDDEALGAGDEILFIELKETAPTIEFARRVLDLLDARRDRYGRNGRPVVLRAFSGLRQSLRYVAMALEDERYVFLRPYVRLSVLFGSDQATGPAAFEDAIDAVAAEGFAMFEPYFRNPHLHTLLAYARSLGLGTNLWTIPASLGEVDVASLREETDVLTVDYPVAKAHAIVEAETSIVYLSAEAALDPAATAVAYFDGAGQAQLASIEGVDRPSLAVGAAGESLYGGYLRFDRVDGDFLPLVGGDANPGEGLLVSAVVRFRDLALADGETRAILASSGSGGFTLDLHDPLGAETAVLRYGVFVGSGYVYATYPVGSLVVDRSYDLIGAYDGDGGVYLFVDHRSGGVTNGSAVGGVVASDVPVTVGADPETGGTARYFADVDVQVASAQRWGSH